MRWHVISGIFWRNVKQYFTGVIGYLFIVVFVTVCAVLAFGPRFFADNIASLDQLSKYFPVLLLFLVPAITMGIWADEKRAGTDSILFTLPASDLEILLGKYISVVAVYSIALLFSVTQLIALSMIGNPDWGVVATTYFGYWLAGVALLSVGMFASSLTSSATVAFVLGACFCAIPVMIGMYFRGNVFVEQFGVQWHLRDFTIGLLSFPSILYFVSLTILMLYLNLIAITHRHWSRGQQFPMLGQFFVRAIAILVVLASLNFMAGRSSAALNTRMDLTSERLFTVDRTTRDTIKKAVKDSHLVSIQAYISNQVPREYVYVKNHFVGLLRQYDRIGGENVNVEFIEVKPNSKETEQAKKNGVIPNVQQWEVAGRKIEQEVFLGAHISSSQGDVAVPFVDGESSIEYQLTRAIASTTDKKKQLTMGVLTTDAFFMGPKINDETVDRWSYSKTLKRLNSEYKLKRIEASELPDYLPEETEKKSDETDKSDSTGATSKAQENESKSDEDDGKDAVPAKKKKTAPDVLLVVDPSSLPLDECANLAKYIAAGNSAIILADPLPFYWASQAPADLGIINAPRQPRVGPQSQAFQFLTPFFTPKAMGGTPQPLLNLLELQWDSGDIVWHDVETPEPIKPFWPDYLGPQWPTYYGPKENVFSFYRKVGSYQPFNQDELISRGLRRLVFAYGGAIRARPLSGKDDEEKAKDEKNRKTVFTPLVSSTAESGLLGWNEVSETPRAVNRRTGQLEAVPSQVTGGLLRVIKPDPQRIADDKSHVVAALVESKESDGPTFKVVWICDADFLTDVIDEEKEFMADLDNVTFLTNAIEVLAGDEDFVRLRNRRPTPRTLEAIERKVAVYRSKRFDEQQKVDKKINKELKDAQDELDQVTAKIGADTEMDFISKLQAKGKQAEIAQRRFELKRKRLERERDEKVSGLRANEQQGIDSTKRFASRLAIGLAPLPALLLGIFVFMYRLSNERSHIQASRRV